MKAKALLLALIVSLFAIFMTGCGDSGEKASKDADTDIAKETEDEDKKDKDDDTEDKKDKAEENDDKAKDKKEDSSKDKKYTEQSFEKLTFNVLDSHKKTEVPDSPMPIIAYLMNALDQSSFNIVAEELPVELSVEEYVEIASANTGYEYISIEGFELGGNTWSEMISNHPNEQLKMNQSVVIHDGVAYVFTYAATEDAYEKYLPEFKDVLKSVKFN